MALVAKEELKDMDMAAAAEQLMQLSGDEENDNTVTCSDTGNADERKNYSNAVVAQSHVGDDGRSSRNHQVLGGLRRLVIKKRRKYRSILHLYMSTKPVRS
ncbi:hypothetical protein ACET3Z_001017 [Daucus carota]